MPYVFEPWRGLHKEVVSASVVEELIQRTAGPLAVVEVGVLFGAHAEVMLSAFDFASYTGVDPYAEPGGDEAYGRARAVFDRWSGSARLLRTPSAAAAAGFAEGSLDLVFLDGDHSYAAVREDIAAWTPKLRAGGRLLGHDYAFHFPGLVRAVRESLPQDQHLRLGHDMMWWYDVT